ncbi:MAG: hypothetical protein V1918_01000 [Planctomycetota bacterium]
MAFGIGDGIMDQRLFWMFMGGISVLFFVINVATSFIVSDMYRRVPREHQEMEPNLVWLLLIPCFNFIWNFFVFPKLSKSYANYFYSRGETRHGDCNGPLALVYAILAACGLIPCLTIISGPAALVVIVVYLVRMSELKKELPMEIG